MSIAVINPSGVIELKQGESLSDGIYKFTRFTTGYLASRLLLLRYEADIIYSL
jgi:hypothetical protein